MKVTVVGCAGSYPGPDSAASCYLLEADHEGRTWRILLDLGNGALGQLHNYVDPRDIDGVIISHLHADHFMDLCGYYVMRKYHPEGPARRIPVWGPAETATRIAVAYGLELDPGMHEEFDFRTLDEPFQVGPFAVEGFEVVHPVQSFAIRVQAGDAVVAYSGDTGPCAALEQAAADADLFLCEASFLEGGDNPPDLHLTGADAGRAARAANVDHLVVTHVPPWNDAALALAEATSEFFGTITLAAPGQVFSLS